MCLSVFKIQGGAEENRTNTQNVENVFVSDFDRVINTPADF